MDWTSSRARSRPPGSPKSRWRTFRRAEIIWERLATRYPDKNRYPARLAQTLFSLGWRLREAGASRDAEAAYRRGVARLKSLTERPHVEPGDLETLAGGYAGLGTIYAESGRNDEAESTYRQVVALRDRVSTPAFANPDRRIARGSDRIALARFLADRHQFAEAEKIGQHALTLIEEIVQEYPGVPEYRTTDCYCRIIIGLIQKDAGRLLDAESSFPRFSSAHRRRRPNSPVSESFATGSRRLSEIWASSRTSWASPTTPSVSNQESIAGLEKLDSEFPDVSRYRADLAKTLVLGAELKRAANREKEAVDDYGKSIALFQALGEALPKRLDYKHDLGQAQLNLGRVFRSMGRSTDAEQAIRLGLSLEEAVVAGAPGVDLYVYDLARPH